MTEGELLRAGSHGARKIIAEANFALCAKRLTLPARSHRMRLDIT
jgi:hypothetical protein